MSSRVAGGEGAQLSVELSRFEATMLVALLVRSLAEPSVYDAKGAPLRRTALANAYRALTAALGDDYDTAK